MATTKNEELAANVGQESSTHEPIENYDSQNGRYAPQTDQLAPPAARPTTNDKSPFGTLRKGG